jgi:hypothetical protein
MKSTTSLVAARPARRRTSLSLILFVAAVVAMGPPVSAAGPAPSPASLQVSIDPRVELFSIIYRLAGFQSYEEGHAASHYEKVVENHFGRYREHPAVSLAIRLKETHNVDYGVQLSLAVHVDDAANLQLRVPLDPWPETLHERWTPELIDEFLAQARDFATQADFAGFVQSQGSFYAETATRAERTLLEGVHVEWFESFFGTRPGGKFQVFISPLGGGNCYAFWVPTEDGIESIAVIGVWQTDRQGKPEFPGGLVSVTVHELAHAYMNPTVDHYLDELTGAVERMGPWLTGRFGEMVRNEGTAGFMHESLTEAATICYLEHTKGTFAARRQLVSNLRNGVFWMPELLATLEQYEARRDSFPAFQAYMPEVVEFFEAYSSRIRSKAAVARASLPLYAVLLGLYLMVAWLPARRWLTTMAKTRWDRVVPFGLLYAVVGPVFEFVALGNRPGLPSLVIGAVLLLAATLIVRRFDSQPGGSTPSDTQAEIASHRPRYLPASLQLSCLLVVIGAPLMLSARLSWIISAIAVVAMLLQARACRAAVMSPDGVGLDLPAPQ